MTYNRQTFFRARSLSDAPQSHPALSLRSSSPALPIDPFAKAPGAGPPKVDHACPGATRVASRTDHRPQQAQSTRASAPARSGRAGRRYGGYFLGLLTLLLLLNGDEGCPAARAMYAARPTRWLVQATTCTYAFQATTDNLGHRPTSNISDSMSRDGGTPLESALLRDGKADLQANSERPTILHPQTAYVHGSPPNQANWPAAVNRGGSHPYQAIRPNGSKPKQANWPAAANRGGSHPYQAIRRNGSKPKQANWPAAANRGGSHPYQATRQNGSKPKQANWPAAVNCGGSHPYQAIRQNGSKPNQANWPTAANCGGYQPYKGQQIQSYGEPHANESPMHHIPPGQNLHEWCPTSSTICNLITARMHPPNDSGPPKGPRPSQLETTASPNPLDFLHQHHQQGRWRRCSQDLSNWIIIGQNLGGCMLGLVAIYLANTRKNIRVGIYVGIMLAIALRPLATPPPCCRSDPSLSIHTTIATNKHTRKATQYWAQYTTMIYYSKGGGMGVQPNGPQSKLVKLWTSPTGLCIC